METNRMKSPLYYLRMCNPWRGPDFVFTPVRADGRLEIIALLEAGRHHRATMRAPKVLRESEYEDFLEFGYFKMSHAAAAELRRVWNLPAEARQ
jgi:hypothetical protein